MIQLEEYSCEILIIGAGPAGCSAGIYCGRSHMDTIILDGKVESAIVQAKEVKNYPGFENIKGNEILDQLKKHAASHESVRIIAGDVISLMMGMGTNMISTRSANITADSIIIATGRGQRKEVIKGEAALGGFGVSYCALCDGPLYRERVVYLYGSDEEVIEDALALDQMGCIVNIIINMGINEFLEELDKTKKEEFINRWHKQKYSEHQSDDQHPNDHHHNDHNHNDHQHPGNQRRINVIDRTEIIEIIGSPDKLIEKILCKNLETNEIVEFKLACLFILSHVPSNSIFKKAGIELDEKGNIMIDIEQKTNIEGVFAAGDVTGGLFQVVFATAEGARAGISANKYVRHLKKE